MAGPASEKSDILIVGAGVFGLSTALSLLQRPQYSDSIITILDAADQLPNTSGASVDSSRILRADYAIKSYTTLVSEAKRYWKDTSDNSWGGQGRYHEAKLLLTAQPGAEGHVDGYLEASLQNIKDLARSGEYDFKTESIRELGSREAIRREIPQLEVSGDYGYLNGDCGWIRAEACMRYALQQLMRVGGQRVKIRYASRVAKLLVGDSDRSTHRNHRCSGVKLIDGTEIQADLVILAAGAWTPSLVDLGGRAMATGQVLAYMRLSQEEQERLKSIPIYFNMSRGMYMIPPHDRELKVGRHGFGYQNPIGVTFQTRTVNGESLADAHLKPTRTFVSTPRTDIAIPAEAEAACKQFLLEIFPEWKDREFYKTRVCWYCDTPTGDFLIDYHPRIEGLFIATGDSGHGFKVFPVIGNKIADAIERKLDPELQELWRWQVDASPRFIGTDDGTRGGRRGMILQMECLQHRSAHL